MQEPVEIIGQLAPIKTRHAIHVSIVFCYQAKAPTSSGLMAPTLSGQSTNMEQIFNAHVNGCQAEAPTSSGLRAPTLSGQNTNMEQLFNTHVNGCQAEALTSSSLRAPTLSGQSTNMDT